MILASLLRTTVQNILQGWRDKRGLYFYGSAGLIFLLLAAGIYFAFIRHETPAFKLETVRRGNIEKTVTALGSIQPTEYVDVGTQVSGQLRVVHFKVGDQVKKGDLLAEIDPTIYESRVGVDRATLDNLQAQRAQKEAQLDLAVLQFERNSDLWKANAISQDSYQMADSNLKTSKAALTSIKAQIEQVRATMAGDLANLGYTKIYAPMTGTVVSQTALAGQTLNANQTAPIILRIARLDMMTVQAQVAEADIAKIADSMPVYFTTLGMPDHHWHSTVRQVLPTPQIINDVVLYTALIDIDNVKHLLKSNMTAQVFFLVGEAKNVVLAPVAALIPPRHKSGETKVRVMTGNGPEERVVVVGLQSRMQAEIQSGITVGEKVIVGSEGGGSKPKRAADAGASKYSRPSL
jgi:macrolide-specific efflux system membrane fusion protein